MCRRPVRGSPFHSPGPTAQVPVADADVEGSRALFLGLGFGVGQHGGGCALLVALGVTGMTGSASAKAPPGTAEEEGGDAYLDSPEGR